MIRELNSSEICCVTGSASSDAQCKWKAYSNTGAYIVGGGVGFASGLGTFATMFSSLGGKYAERKALFWVAGTAFGILQGALVGAFSGCSNCYTCEPVL